MSKFIYLCVLLAGQQLVGGVLSPNYEFDEQEELWLRLHLVPATWQDARRRCQLEGGILASPSSTGLTQAMLSAMALHKLKRPVFTGIHDLISNGDFMSLDGTRIENINLDWAPGEPDNQNKAKNCLLMNNSGEMADTSCNSVYPYFCRKDNVTMEFNKECGTTASGYQYFQITGSCYKFHRYSKTWSHAARVCHAEGGHLTIVNSETEAQVITDIFKKNPVDSVIGAKHSDVAHVGFWKWGDDKDGEFLTIHGQTLEQAGYNQWGRGQPNKYGGVQTVGSIQRGGGFDDLAPYDLNPFICEITP